MHHMKTGYEKSQWQVPEVAKDVAQSSSAFPPSLPAEMLLKLEDRETASRVWVMTDTATSD